MDKLVEGERLHLRLLRRTDLDRTWEWLHRPDIYTKIGVKVPFSKQQQEAWFDALQHDEAKIVFAVCRNDDDVHIGNVSLDMIDRRHRNARLSIFIADAQDRGQGLGSEALALLERYAFVNLDLHRIWCKTDAGHPEVLRFYQKLGFAQEGVLRQHELKDGVFVDKAIFGKIRETP